MFATLALTLRAGAPPSVSGIITHTDRVDPITPLGATSFLGFPEAASFNLTTRTFDPDSKLLRETVVLVIRRPTQLVFLHHKQDIPLQARSHVGDEPRGHVGVGVDSRPGGKAFGVRG